MLEEKVNEKLDSLFKVLDNNLIIKEIQELKINILNNKELLEVVSNLQTFDTYSYQYQELKKKLFKNRDFIRFKELENELNLLILEINQKLKLLTYERGCNHEGN